MHIPSIRSQADYQALLKEASALVDMDPTVGTFEGDRLSVLTTLIQAYEAKHFQIDLLEPIQVAKK